MKEFNSHINQLLSSLNELKKTKEHAKSFHEDKLYEQATFYRTEVWEAMAKTRYINERIALMK